jgi:hypothetical protein
VTKETTFNSHINSHNDVACPLKYVTLNSMYELFANNLITGPSEPLKCVEIVALTILKSQMCV